MRRLDILDINNKDIYEINFLEDNIFNAKKYDSDKVLIKELSGSYKLTSSSINTEYYNIKIDNDRDEVYGNSYTVELIDNKTDKTVKANKIIETDGIVGEYDFIYLIN